MEKVTTHYAKTHLSKLLSRVRQGETIIIARNQEPVATLSPIAPEKKPKRRFGDWIGRVEIVGDVMAPLDEEDIKPFYGE